MNRKELCDYVYSEVFLNPDGTKRGKRSLCDEAVYAVVEKIRDSILSGDKVNLKGFGTFLVVERKAKKGLNPRTGEAVDIPAKLAVKYVPSSTLRATLNQPQPDTAPSVSEE